MLFHTQIRMEYVVNVFPIEVPGGETATHFVSTS